MSFGTGTGSGKDLGSGQGCFEVRTGFRGAKQRLRITPGQNMVSQGSVQRSLDQNWQGFQIKKMYPGKSGVEGETTESEVGDASAGTSLVGVSGPSPDPVSSFSSPSRLYSPSVRARGVGGVRAGNGGGGLPSLAAPSSSPGSCLLPFRALPSGRVRPRDCEP